MKRVRQVCDHAYRIERRLYVSGWDVRVYAMPEPMPLLPLCAADFGTAVACQLPEPPLNAAYVVNRDDETKVFGVAYPTCNIKAEIQAFKALAKACGVEL
jgi:hypothetical protein